MRELVSLFKREVFDDYDRFDKPSTVLKESEGATVANIAENEIFINNSNELMARRDGKAIKISFGSGYSIQGGVSSQEPSNPAPLASYFIGKRFDKDLIGDSILGIGTIPQGVFLKNIYVTITEPFDDTITMRLDDSLEKTLLYEEEVDLTIVNTNVKTNFKYYESEVNTTAYFDGVATKGEGFIILEVIKVQGL